MSERELNKGSMSTVSVLVDPNVTVAHYCSRLILVIVLYIAILSGFTMGFINTLEVDTENEKKPAAESWLEAGVVLR